MCAHKKTGFGRFFHEEGLVFSPSAADLIIHEPVRQQHYRGTRRSLQGASLFRHLPNCDFIRPNVNSPYTGG
jgi:hypothetical protein